MLSKVELSAVAIQNSLQSLWSWQIKYYRKRGKYLWVPIRKVRAYWVLFVCDKLGLTLFSFLNKKQDQPQTMIPTLELKTHFRTFS